jgi:hypothetical protein
VSVKASPEIFCRSGRRSGTVLYDLNGKELRTNTWSPPVSICETPM